MDYENKYYKYKMKYLQLKEELMKQGYDMDNFMMGEGKKNLVNKVTLDDLIKIAAKINNCDDLSKPGKKIKCQKPGKRVDGMKKNFSKFILPKVKKLFNNQLNATPPILKNSTKHTLVLLALCDVDLDIINNYYNSGDNYQKFLTDLSDKDNPKYSPIYQKIMEIAKKGNSFSLIGTNINNNGFKQIKI